MSEKTFTNFKLLSSQPKFVCLYFFFFFFLFYTYISLLYVSSSHLLRKSCFFVCLKLRTSFLVLTFLKITCFLCTLYKNKTLRSSEGSHSYTQFLLLVLSFFFCFTLSFFPFLLLSFPAFCSLSLSLSLSLFLSSLSLFTSRLFFPFLIYAP